MSEKTKTPRDLAGAKYPLEIAPTDEAYMYSYNAIQQIKRDAYLAGLEAGAKMGYNYGMERAWKLSDEAVLLPSFQEWWASLEKK